MSLPVYILLIVAVCAVVTNFFSNMATGVIVSSLTARVIAPAMSTGQAAAVAADYCIKNNILPTDVDGKIIHKLMIEEEKVPLDKLPDGHWEMMRSIEGEFVVDRSDSVHIIGKDGTFYR